MTHETCQEKLLDLAYGELDPAEAAEVESHLEGCERCRAEQARLLGVRSVMRRLEPEPPPVHGEHLLLTAARHAAEQRVGRRGLLPPWIWRLALTVTALVVVGTVSFRVLSLRGRPGGAIQDRSIEGRPETFAGSAMPPAAAPQPESFVPAVPPMPEAEERPPIAGQGAKLESHTTPSASRAKKGSSLKGAPPSSRSVAPEVEEKREMQLVPRPPAPAPVSALELEKHGRSRESIGAADMALSMQEEAPRATAPAAPPGKPQPPSLESGRTARPLQSAQELVKEIEEARRQGRLVESTRPTDSCGPDEDSERRLYSLEGRVVAYQRRLRRQEQLLTIDQHYDSEGRLRHARILATGPAGAGFEHHVWLDPLGNRLEEQRRPGQAPRAERWPEGDLKQRAPDVSVLSCGGP